MLINDTKYSNLAYSNEYQAYLDSNFKIRTQKAEEYNQLNNALITLPNEMLHEIYGHTRHNPSSDLSDVVLTKSQAPDLAKTTNDRLAKDDDAIEALKKSIKTFMKLRSTCKFMYRFLTYEKIAKFCENYTPETKLLTFKNLMKVTSTPDDEIRHTPAIIVLYTGIDTSEIKNELECLLVEAVKCNNIHHATILFRHKPDPNIQHNTTPLFFYAKTIEMVQIFIENNVDIHTTISCWPGLNVLWEVVKTIYPSDLMKFYLNNHVNANKLHPSDNSCLFHKLPWSNLSIDTNFFKKAQLLLEAIPYMVNTFDNKEQTPLDLAYNALEIYRKKNRNSDTLETVITLLREHGGKTRQELEIEKKYET